MLEKKKSQTSALTTQSHNVKVMIFLFTKACHQHSKFYYLFSMSNSQESFSVAHFVNNFKVKRAFIIKRNSRPLSFYKNGVIIFIIFFLRIYVTGDDISFTWVKLAETHSFIFKKARINKGTVLFKQTNLNRRL